MDNDRSSNPTGTTDRGGATTDAAVDETEREVITSGTAATSEVGDPAAQESARRQPGGPADTTDTTGEDGEDSGNSGDREDREPRG